MFPFDGGPQTGNQFTTSAVNQQNTQLLGNPQGNPVQQQPPLDPQALNSTAFQSNPNVTNVVKALKGSA